MICLCYKHLARYVYPLKKICKKARYHAFPSISKIFVGFSNIKQRLLICCCLVRKRNNTVLQKLETYPAKDASFIETKCTVYWTDPIDTMETIFPSADLVTLFIPWFLPNSSFLCVVKLTELDILSTLNNKLHPHTHLPCHTILKATSTLSGSNCFYKSLPVTNEDKNLRMFALLGNCLLHRLQ